MKVALVYSVGRGRRGSDGPSELGAEKKTRNANLSLNKTTKVKILSL